MIYTSVQARIVLYTYLVIKTVKTRVRLPRLYVHLLVPRVKTRKYFPYFLV